MSSDCGRALDKCKGKLKKHSPCLAVKGVKSEMFLLDVLHSLCRLGERCTRAEDTDKLPFYRVLGQEPLNGFARQRFILMKPLRRVEDFLENRKILVIDLLN